MCPNLKSSLMTSVMVLALPVGVLAAEQNTATDQGVSQPVEQATSSYPPAPQGPFFSRGMMANPFGGGHHGIGQPGMHHGGFAPMGFDPMAKPAASVGSTAAQAQQAPPFPVSGNHANAFGGSQGNSQGGTATGDAGGNANVDFQVRGRIAMGGHGAGNNGWGHQFMNGMPYGMPYGQGYGAPYGTPYSQANTAPQYALQPLKQTAPNSDAASAATPQAGTPKMQTARAYGAPVAGYGGPFSWAPQGRNMANPGGFFGQQQPAPQGYRALQGYRAPQGYQAPRAYQLPQAPQARAQAPSQAQAVQPDWVNERRAAAEQRYAEAKQRFADRQRTNPYAQQGYGRGFGQPIAGQGYGAPYGTPYGYAPQPHTPAPSSDDSAQ
ncbi:MAG: hypothetical protein JKY27_02995 [Magnetovibrio sp.]|nr:hypothetical protein [Magnetovibrio sp.]